jgi:hypothetical protein
MGILLWLQEIGIPVTFQNSAGIAADKGHLHILKWLWENEGQGVENFKQIFSPVSDPFALGYNFKKIAEGGHIEVLKFLFQNGVPIKWRKVGEYAASQGKWRVVRWVVEEEREALEEYPEVYQEAARRGDLEIIKWLREEKYKWDWRLYAGAGTAGRVDLMQWAKEEGCKWDDRATSEIFSKTEEQKNTLGVLQWIHEQGYQIRPEDVVMGGRVEVLEWLLELEGASAMLGVGARCFGDIAAGAGNLPLLTWLKNLGVLLSSSQIYDSGARNGHVKVLKWAKKNGFAPCEYPVIKYGGNLIPPLAWNVLRWFHDNGVQMSSFQLKDIARADGGYYKWKIIRWAIKAGIKVDPELCDLIHHVKTKALSEEYLEGVIL